MAIAIGTQPLVSIIVPVFGHEQTLSECIRALQAQDSSDDFEIIVVNNGDPGQLIHFAAEFPDVRFIDEQTPGSYNARNRGITHARGHILAFTDADCVPDRSWITNGIRKLVADPRCGLVGGRVELVPRNPRQITTGELYDLVFGFQQKSYIEGGHFAATANMLTRRDVFNVVGRFRGNLFSGGDAEWGQRVFEAGYSLVFDETARVSHPARDFNDLIRKLRRAAAGARDRNPEWRACLSSCSRYIAPVPYRTLRRIIGVSDFGITVRQKLLLVGMVAYIRWRTVFERLRLQLGQGSSSRS